MTQFKVDLASEDLGILDDEGITLQQAFAIKAASGLSLKAFFDGINEADPLAYQTLVWFQRFKAGISTPLQEIDFRMSDLHAVAIIPPQVPAQETVATSAGSETTPSAS